MEEAVAGEGELGEDEEVHPRFPRLSDPVEMALDIALDVAEAAVDLRQADPEDSRAFGHDRSGC